MEYYVHTEAQKEGAKELQELQEKIQEMLFDFNIKHRGYMTFRIEEGKYGRLKLIPIYIIKLGE